ncbi:MAG: WD40/YVTN/BNR-like repeat-containing protein [Thermoanaerobaculia bacterium]
MNGHSVPGRSGGQALVFPRTVATALAVFLCAIALAAQPQKAVEEESIKAPLAARSLLLDAARAGSSLVVVGERGHILVSSDSGKSWRQADVPTRAMLTGVHFHDAKLGWAVGHDAVILRTRDGGTKWELVHSAPEDETPFLDVWFADAQTGFAIGAYGRCFATRDGGTTWEEQPVSDDDFHLNQIARSASGRIYIAAESGNAFRSDDGGTTWTPLTVPYEGSLFGVLPLEGDAVLLFGLRGHLLRSEDAGATWAPVETGTTAMLNSGVRLPDGTIAICALGGVVLVSHDGGRTFQVHQQSTRAGLQGVFDAGNGRVLLVGEAGAEVREANALSSGKDE